MKFSSDCRRSEAINMLDNSRLAPGILVLKGATQLEERIPSGHVRWSVCCRSGFIPKLTYAGDPFDRSLEAWDTATKLRRID